MPTGFEGKVALVTGGSRGIGAATVRAFAQLGAQVAFTYLSSSAAAQSLSAELDKAKQRVRAYQADQAEQSTPASLISTVARDFGRLDILVNNAAIAVLGRLDDPGRDVAALERQMTVNYTSIVATIRAAIPILPEGGRIINIGSGIAARTGAQGVADHAGTKAALGGFTRGAARDLA